MHTFRSTFRPLAWISALILAAVMSGCGDGIFGGGDDNVPGAGAGTPNAPGAGAGVGGAGQGPAPVNLGAAAPFVILSEAAITNVPTSAVTGDVGASPITGASIGLLCTEVTGTIYSVDAAGPLPCRVTDATLLTNAVNAKNLAYTDATGRTPDYTELGAGTIGGLNLAPATYRWSSPVLIPTNLTLTGGPNDVWIFQISQTLTVASGVQIILAGGALPENVFWATFAAADFGTTSQFKGIVLSQSSVALATNASIDGRLFAGTGAAFDQNRVTQP